MIKQCLVSISERGLKGLQYTEFLEILRYNAIWGPNVKCPLFKERLFLTLLKSKKVLFYSPVDIPADGPPCDKPRHIVDDHIRCLRGYCPAYDKLEWITVEESTTFEHIIERYPQLHITTNQPLRNEVYIRDTNVLLLPDVNPNQYAVYEYFRRVGKHGFTAKDLQKAFNCKASSIVFYTEFLEKCGAAKMLLSVKCNGKQKSREHYWLHRRCTESVKCVIEVVNSMMKLVPSRSLYFPSSELRGLFDESLKTIKLVDSVEESYKLVEHFLTKLCVVSPSDDNTGTFEVKTNIEVTGELKEAEPVEPAVVSPPNFYGDMIIFGEPLEGQILRLMDSRGAAGISSADVNAHFGISNLLFRVFAKNLIADGVLTTFSTMSAKTFQHMYVLKKYVPDIKDEEGSGNESSKLDTSRLNHLPLNLQRLEIIHNIFKKNKALSRPEIRKYLRDETNNDQLAQVDSKTLNRLLSSLCKEGKLVHLVLHGTNVTSDMEPRYTTEMYHVPDCDQDYLEDTIRILKIRLDRQSKVSDARKAASHAFLGAYRHGNFNVSIPKEIESKEPYKTEGTFHGPKAIFFQRLHLVLSVLIYRWPLPSLIPQHLIDIRDWWEYVLTVNPPPAQKDNTYEVFDIVNYLPIYFVVQFFNKGLVYDGFKDVMNDVKYKRCCVGQLPSNLAVTISNHILTVNSSLAKSIEVLHYMGLVEIKCPFDYTKKRFSGFKFKPRVTALLLNTKDAPIHIHKLKGYNIRRIDKVDRILVFDVSKFSSFIEYWYTAKDLCLSESISFGKAIQEPIRTLQQVLTDYSIPLDQSQQFYNSAGTSERLDSVYSELGPAGFSAKLFFERKDAWCERIVSTGRGIRPDLTISNATRVVKPERTEIDEESGSDDYAPYNPRKTPIKRNRTRPRNKNIVKQPKKINQKRPPTSKKRSGSVSEKRAVKRIKKRYRDDIDTRITAAKTMERVKFSSREDEILILYTVCTKVCKETISPNDVRDVLHNYCPDESYDKTVESCKKRRTLLVDKPESRSRMIDLQAKGMAYSNIAVPKILKSLDLLEKHDEWANDDFKVRNILPASYADFKQYNSIEVPDAEKHNFMTVFLSDSYRNKRIKNYISCNVNSIWENTDIPDSKKHIYNIIMASVTSNQSVLHNEVSHAVMKDLREGDVASMSEYMFKHQIIRRQKKKVNSEGKTLPNQRIGVSTDASQCFYSPFPDEIISVEASTCSLIEVYYSKLTPKLIHDISQHYLNLNSKVIISGAIDPFIDRKKYCSAFENTKNENDVYEEVHVKRNTFYSGISTVEEAASIGFQISEKHISGRINYKVHHPAADEKVEGYEDLLGIKENYVILPLKIFINLAGRKELLNWNKLDLETGRLREPVLYDVPPRPTELSVYQLNLAAHENISLPYGETGQIKVFSGYCKSNDLHHFIQPGSHLLSSVFGAKERGITEDTLQAVVEEKYPGLPKTLIPEILNLCINFELVVKVGYTSSLIVGKHYSTPWLVTLQCGASSKIKPSQPKQSEEEMESDVTKFFPVSLKPWRSVNSDLNLDVLQHLVRSVVLLIYAYPGTSKEIIDRRYHAFLSPNSSKELLECLLVSDIIRRHYDKPSPASLFSSTLPHITLSRTITQSSCFTVTDSGLKNLAAFMVL